MGLPLGQQDSMPLINIINLGFIHVNKVLTNSLLLRLLDSSVSWLVGSLITLAIDLMSYLLSDNNHYLDQ